MENYFFLLNYATSEGAVYHTVLYYQPLAITPLPSEVLCWLFIWVVTNSVHCLSNINLTMTRAVSDKWNEVLLCASHNIRDVRLSTHPKDASILVKNLSQGHKCHDLVSNPTLCWSESRRACEFCALNTSTTCLLTRISCGNGYFGWLTQYKRST